MLDCLICGKPHNRKRSFAKFCLACSRKAYYRNHPKKEERRVVSDKTSWRGSSYLGITPSATDWARLAAYIDGEGSINLSPRKANGSNSVTFCGKVVVTNTDARLAIWCEKNFGMKIHVQGHRWAQERAIEREWKPCYHSQTSGYRASWIAVNCLPWFLLKREQAQVIIDHQETTEVGTWERGSGVSTPQNILDYRLSLKQKLTDLNRRGPKEKVS